MIIEYVEKMRQQPLDVRRHAVVTWTVVAVIVIAVLYGVFLIVRGVAMSGDTGTVENSLITPPYSNTK